MHATKAEVKQFWEAAPCGTRDTLGLGEQERHRELERMRDAREPFISGFARFAETAGERVLEVGVGEGTDHLRFTRAGNRNSASADAEPFEDDRFDVVYSWGVIHHTPDPPRAARESLRVLRPGGRFCVIVYNRRSLVALQTWLRYAALRGRFGMSAREAIARHMESPGTQAYSAAEAGALFPARDVRVDTRITGYDLRVGRRIFLPRSTWPLVPPSLGWFHIVQGTK